MKANLLILVLIYLFFHFEIKADEGKEILIYSNALKESRRIQIYTPAHFIASKSYPVIYVFDGDGHAGHAASVAKFLSFANKIPPVIVVGISNVDRVRDFTPHHSLIGLDGSIDSIRFKNTGGGDKFLLFITTEVVPYVEKNYKTLPYRVLLGHSLGGLFALHAFKTEQSLFQAAILISPAFYGGNKKVLHSFPKYLQNNKSQSNKLFVTIGNEPRLQNGVDTLNIYLRESSSSIKWKYQRYEEENHHSVPFISWYDGLTFIFEDWALIKSFSSRDSLDMHFANLSKKLGFEIMPIEEIVLDFGLNQLYSSTSTSKNETISLFIENAKRHPDSSIAFECLAEAYLLNGDKKNAIENYKKALKLNPKFESVRRILNDLRKR